MLSPLSPCFKEVIGSSREQEDPITSLKHGDRGDNMALLAFYGGLVLVVGAGMTIMALLVMSRAKEKAES